MKSIGIKITTAATVLICVAVAYYAITSDSLTGGTGFSDSPAANRPVPVEVAPIETGGISLRRTFSGALEPRAQFVAAPKVSGRIKHIYVSLADTVRRGQVVARLDNEEYVQQAAQAKADLTVARANLAEAESVLEIARRELERIKTLRARGIASESQLDSARASHLAKAAALEVARARVTHAESSLETANIRLGYTEVVANWTGPGDERVVAERFIDEGETVSANTPLLLIVQLDPIIGVIHVTEKDYGMLQPGQSVLLFTDAYRDERFKGKIERIAPVFQQASRQAKVELIIENPRNRLKPGMFIRATVVLERMENATIIPDQALTRRNDRSGVFVVGGDGKSVVWREITVGIRDGDRVQVSGEGLSGKVVVLGQQLLDDGSPIIVPAEQNPPNPSGQESSPG